MNRTYNIRTPAPMKFKWAISGSAGPNGSPAYSKFTHDIHAILKSSLAIKIFFLYCSLPYINRESAKASISDAIK
jgi:hypothetical protein